MAMGSPPRGTRNRRLWRSVARTGAISLVVVAALIVLAPWMSFIEVRSLDGLYRLSPPRHPNPSIAVVDVGDDPSAYEDQREPDDAPPELCEIPRRAYAEAVRRLSRWGARVIVFDLMFRKRYGAEDDDLAAAFREAGNVVVAASTKTKPGAVGLQEPVEPLNEAVWGVGAPVAYQPNETIRSVPLVLADYDSGRQYLALPLLAFQCFVGAQPADMKLSEGRLLVTGGRELPLLPGETIHLLPFGAGGSAGGDGSAVAAVDVVRGSNVEELPALKTWNTLLINWVGPPGTIQPGLMSDLLALDDDAEGRRLYSGKAVIIGRGVSETQWDEHWTAVGSMRGPEVQANALDTLISGAFIRPMAPWAFLALLATFAAVTTLMVQRLKGTRSVLGVLALMLLALALGRELLVRRGIWMYLFVGESSILLAWGITIAAQSDKVTSLLSRFVPAFLGEPEHHGLGEVRTLDASILWTDIRRYTGISEQFAAEDILRLLNSYHSAAEDIITEYGGTIVKTPGDAILAAFWRDVGGVNHATCAMRAGQEIIANLPALAQDWAAAGIRFETGVGINAGPVAMGLVGKQHLEPTIIGDAVNVAQRLEALTKDIGYPLIFSESVHERLQDDIDAVCLDEVTVKGRQVPIRVYGVVGSEGSGKVPEQDSGHATPEGANER